MPRSPALCLTWYGMPSINAVLRTNQALTVLVWQTRVTSERIVQVGRLVQGSTRAVNTPVRSELHTVCMLYGRWPVSTHTALASQSPSIITADLPWSCDSWLTDRRCVVPALTDHPHTIRNRLRQTDRVIKPKTETITPPPVGEGVLWWTCLCVCPRASPQLRVQSLPISARVL